MRAAIKSHQRHQNLIIKKHNHCHFHHLIQLHHFRNVIIIILYPGNVIIIIYHPYYYYVIIIIILHPGNAGTHSREEESGANGQGKRLLNLFLHLKLFSQLKIIFTSQNYFHNSTLFSQFKIIFTTQNYFHNSK